MNDDKNLEGQKENKNYTKQILIIVMAVYIVLGAVTAFIFAAKGSYIQASTTKEMKYNLFPEKNEVQEPQETQTTQTSTEDSTPVEEEPVIEEAAVEAEEPEVVSTVSEASAPQKQEVPEPEEIKYYRFTVVTTDTWLNIRENPDTESKVVGHFGKAETGYVLKKGDDFSLVTTGKKTGYVKTEYLTLTEISAEDYPEKYK